jgi:hypothetical protein
VFPVWHLLADVGEFAGGEVISSVSNRPQDIAGLVVRKAGRTRVLLADFGSDSRRVALKGWAPGDRAMVRVMDVKNAEAAMRDPEAFRAQARAARGGEAIEIPRFGYVCADYWTGG